VWFEPEPESVVLTEMTKVVGCHDQIWTLLWMLKIERVRGDPRDDDEGGWEPGRRKGPPPVRNLDRPRKARSVQPFLNAGIANNLQVSRSGPS
jgi:hypothetical protein